MNNEEKILSILENMQSDISGLKAGQVRLESKVDGLEAGQLTLADEIHKTNRIIELDIQPKIQVLFEGHADHSRVLSEHTAALERIENKIDRLSETQIVHEIELQALTK